MSMRRIGSNSYLLFLGAFTLGICAFGGTGLFFLGSAPAHSEQTAPVEPTWAAAAPGRVEPKGRELRIAASAPAAIKEVLVQLNDRVKTGDLMIQLDSQELKAKLGAAKAEAAVRAAERDAAEVKGTALERRKAEDTLYNAERSAFDARLELDHLFSRARLNQVSAEDVEKGRGAVTAADEKVERERVNLKRVLSKNLPALTREEAALSAARAEVAVVSTALERMHIRSPVDASVLELHAKLGEMATPSADTPLLVLGDTSHLQVRAEVAVVSTALERMHVRSPVDATVLELHAKLGEMASPSADSPLLVLGDTTHLQVRAEVQERDVRKIYPGQAAIVKSDAFPNRSFDARVSVMARALGAPQLAARQGQRKQTDVDVLEVVLDLDEGVPLLPGMRTDVLFKEAESMPKSSVAKTE